MKETLTRPEKNCWLLLSSCSPILPEFLIVQNQPEASRHQSLGTVACRESAFLPFKAKDRKDLTANWPRTSTGTLVGLQNLLGFGISKGQLLRRGKHRDQSPGESDQTWLGGEAREPELGQPLVWSQSRDSPWRGLLPASGRSHWHLIVVRQKWMASRRREGIQEKAQRHMTMYRRGHTLENTRDYCPEGPGGGGGGPGDCGLIYLTFPFF